MALRLLSPLWKIERCCSRAAMRICAATTPWTKLVAGLHATAVQNRGSMSFFNHLTGDALWASATSVSNAGRKRGRARGRKMIKNLNRGQQLGVGTSIDGSELRAVPPPMYMGGGGKHWVATLQLVSSIM